MNCENSFCIYQIKGKCDNSKYLLHIFDLDTNKTIKILNTRNCCDIVDFLIKLLIEMMLKLSLWIFILHLKRLYKLN